MSVCSTCGSRLCAPVDEWEAVWPVMTSSQESRGVNPPTYCRSQVRSLDHKPTWVQGEKT